MASPSQDPPKPALLSLPAELRNRIYRLALVQDAEIRIAPSHSPPPEPALLSTCRQVRGEARNIYYQDNTFLFGVSDFDAAMLVTFESRSRTHRRANHSLALGGGPNWANLKAWIRAVFEGRGHYFSRRFDDEAVPAPLHEHLAVMCFDVMMRLRARGMEWKQAKGVLEDLHRGMAAADPRWK